MARGQLQTSDQAAESSQKIQDDLAAYGIYAEGSLADEAVEEFSLWPECVPVWNVWSALQSQWEGDGKGRRRGLNHSSVDVCVRRKGWPEEESNEAFWLVLAMERAFLEEQGG